MIINRKPREKRSIVWTIDKLQLEEIVKKSQSISEILRFLGYNTTGKTHSVLQERLKKDNIDFSHIKLGTSSNKGKHFNYKMTLDECLKYLFVDTKQNASNNSIRNYIKHYKLKDYKCVECGICEIWNNKKLTLHLDHINGNKIDNRLENLRFLCPNCHSQTETFGAKNHHKKEKKIKKCKKCDKLLHKSTTGEICIKCWRKENVKERFTDPIFMSKLVWEKNLTELGKELSFSANGIKKYCKRHNIALPPQGYWQRISAGYSTEDALYPKEKTKSIKKLLTENQVKEIRQLLMNTGLSYREIGHRFNTDHKVISAIKNGKTYQHIL
jgi:hypothetical protein